MLKQLVAVQGVGLFHDAGPSPSLNRVSLIFGENGRGKSTLASILRSCGEGNEAIITARTTLDGALAPSVDLTFVAADGSDEQARFTNTKWTKAGPNLEVFDADFVSQNVYAGSEISSDQRAGLLEFALGEKAVALRKRVDEAATKLAEATTAINNQTAVLRARAGTMSVDAFVKLQVAQNADTEIGAIEKRIAAANARDELLKKTLPAKAALPTFDAGSLFAILARSLPEIENAAEEAVRQHIKKCAHPNFEQWLSQGSAYDIGDGCPYCGASIEGNDLIQAYRTHFNKAYDDLKTTASKLEAQVILRLGDVVVDGIERSIETAQAHIDGWKGFVERPPLAFDAAGMKAALAKLRSLVEPFAAAKARQPLEAIGSQAEAEKAAELWAAALTFVKNVNDEIATAISEIDIFKKSLAAEDVPKLRATITDLNLRKLRHTVEVVSEVDQLAKLTDAKRARSDEKEIARKALDALMKETLAAYQAEINTLLAAFGAQIRIDSLSFDYRGGAGLPRSDYRLKVRGRDIRLAGNGLAAFGNSLSEGDKRALAFAFFIARLHQDPRLGERLVVIDDPMCSLDRRRRAATIRVLKVLATRCKQLIVLAHDPFFLQALDDELTKLVKTLGPLGYCKIVSAENDYSNFGDLVLSDECSGQYEKDLATVIGYMNAQPGYAPGQVAKCLRVILETSLHRQFPSYIPRNSMLGTVIGTIEKAVSPSPLVVLQPHVKELRALNDYATAFHHADDNSSSDVSSIDEGELRAYGSRVLAFVLRG